MSSDGIGGRARTNPGSVAVVSPGRSTTFGELDQRQRLLAGALASAGIREGDRIAVLSQNSIGSIEVTTGALRAAVVPVPINPLLTQPEIAYLLEDSGAKWLFTDRSVDLAPGLDRIVTFGDAYERCLQEAEPVDLCDWVRGRPMHYTSGTTGLPKGVWVMPYDEARAESVSRDFRELWGISAEDIHLVCSPLAHSAPHRFSMRTLEAGGVVAVQRGFDPAEILAAIELYGVTSTFMVPTHLERIFALGGRVPSRHDISSLRLLAHAGAPISEATKRMTIEAFPFGSVWEFYGSTEGQATRISSEEWLRKPGSVGTARAGGSIEVTDENGRPLPPGEVGEIWVGDPSAESWEYWNDPAKTAEAWRAGAFTAGDLGWLDDDGYLFLAARKHDTIITGGVNVYPQEVEQVLVQHPAVTEAMVYAATSDEWGEEVRAHVVLATGAELSAEDLRAWARSRLAGFKCPKSFEFVDDLPRTPTGKLKRPLREARNL